MKLLCVVLLLSMTGCVPAYAGTHYGFDDYDREPYVQPIQEVAVDGTDYEYGGVEADLPPLSVTFVYREDHYGDVVFHNALTSWQVGDILTFTLPDGLTLEVNLEAGPGDAPDVMTVVPPAGFYAEPKSISVDEDESGTIEIHELLLG